MTTSKSECAEAGGKAAVFRVIVNLVAQYGDTSYLQPGRLIGGTPKGYGDRVASTAVIANALGQSAAWYEAIRTAPTKRPPALYVMPLALQALYPDRREAKRSHQFVIQDPTTIQNTVRDWYQEALADLIAIGEDAV